MNKELEACFKEIYHEIEYVYDSKVNSKANKNWSNDIKHYDNIRGNVLTIQRYLESIDNANPSEALEKLLDGYSKGIAGRSYYDAIKPVLLKEQEQEKLIIELCEYCGMDNLYPYDNLNEIEIAFKDTFDNYQRQRIESLGRLYKQEKLIKIIKEKNVDINYLRYEAVNVKMYNDYVSQLNKVSTINHSSLTEEEFNLVKRC